MKWTLVILTVAGGHSEPKRTLEACQRQLHHTRVSETREAYCMSVKGDAVFFMRDGKHMAAIR
jgi:hypothetical protein